MALSTGFIALVTPALADSLGNASTAIRIASGAGLLFTVVHVVVLIARALAMNAQLNATNWAVAATIDIGVIVAGVASIVTANGGAYEWLLALMIARPGLAFLLALREVTAG